MSRSLKKRLEILERQHPEAVNASFDYTPYTCEEQTILRRAKLVMERLDREHIDFLNVAVEDRLDLVAAARCVDAHSTQRLRVT